jgi:hypothetical protein
MDKSTQTCAFEHRKGLVLIHASDKWISENHESGAMHDVMSNILSRVKYYISNSLPVYYIPDELDEKDVPDFMKKGEMTDLDLSEKIKVINDARLKDIDKEVKLEIQMILAREVLISDRIFDVEL